MVNRRVMTVFRTGEFVVHGSSGVCRVEGMEERQFPGGEKRMYYTLKPIYQNGVVYTPVDSDKVFLRPVISREEAQRLVDTIPSLQVQIDDCRVVSELAQHYEQAIESHRCIDLIQLAMSIYAKKQNRQEQKRKIGTVDERFLKRAEDLLFSELSVALDIPKDEVPRYISSRVQTLRRGGPGRSEKDQNS